MAKVDIGGSAYLYPMPEIVSCYTEERFMTEGSPDVTKIEPIVLTMPDNSYWTVGECVARAWSIGKKLKGGS